MNCSQFRSTYSDFADGLLDELQEVEFHAHMAECRSCRRFDAALRRGVVALQGATRPLPSAGFDRRLYARIAADCAQRDTRALVALAGTVAILGVVGALGWEARSWIAPVAPPAPPAVAQQAARFDPSALRWAPEAPRANRGRFTVLPAREDSTPARERRAQPVEVTIDWMAP